MNKDARQDHTLRNALLLTGGLAVGGVGAAKILEKNALKSLEKSNPIGKRINNSIDSIVSKTKNAEAKTEEKAASNIKTKPKETSKSKISVSDRITKLEEYEKKLEKQIKDSINEEEKKKLIKTLEFVKSEIAKLKLGGL